MLCDSEKCTGCAACYNVCSFDAISMSEDDLGAVKPVIDLNKCKECGLCKKVCPVILNNKKNKPIKCYAAYTKNEKDVKTVTSGGVATAFGRYVLSENGVVYGTEFDQTAKFSRAEDVEMLEKFKGSKYVYIFPDKIYQAVKNDLKNGRTCLFVGTPCQIDGLKSFLRKEYENLITVDLICHGTPPFKYLKEHLMAFDGKYKKVSFRGEKEFKLICSDEIGTILFEKPHHLDEYYVSFLEALTYRENCYVCSYAKPERVSDLTIGDFWGLDNNALNGYKGKKSVVLINTERGKAFFDKASELLVFEERDVHEAIRGNAQLRNPSNPHRKREIFKCEYKKSGFKISMRKSGISFCVLMNRIKFCIKNIFKHSKN